MTEKLLSNRLITKIMMTFLLMILLVGLCYVTVTWYFTNSYFEEASQRLNAQVAQHLIKEKFNESSPFLEDGQVNKPIFGDIMHDMMAVNQSIEVYLLDEDGVVLYSVVLDHTDPKGEMKRVDLAPVRRFIQTDGKDFIVGDDPRNPGVKKIFSAAEFESGGKKGFIYIVLASKQFEKVTDSLLGSYSVQLGLGVFGISIFLAGGIGMFVLYYLTRNLRQIIFAVRRFKEGDMTSRIPDAEHTDLSVLSTTFNEMADTLVANIEKLKSVESLRRELIANVSHDLRTPLAIMQGYVETLQMKKDVLDKKKQDEYLSIVLNSIEKLSHLINQLFEFSKLEAQQIEPQKEPFMISELAHDIHQKYLTLAQRRGIELILQVEENLPLVFADISLVERALQNLMDNALKYTPSGGQVVLEMHASPTTVLVAIRDTGPGIPEEEQSYIFERFKRASSTSPGVSGSGLGLAIVKKIMEIHESTIRVISKPEEGTVFQFDLPVYSH